MGEETLVERLREASVAWHDPACPFPVHCYCGDDSEPPPHDRGGDPLYVEAADEITRLQAALEEERRDRASRFQPCGEVPAGAGIVAGQQPEPSAAGEP